MAQLSREQFVSELLHHVRQKFPLVKLSTGQQDFTVSVNGHVASLENLYRLTNLHPDERLHHIDRWMVELLRAAEGAPDRRGTFDELKDRLMPMILPAPPASQPDRYNGAVTQPLVEGLVVGYAIDSDRTIAYLPQELFDEWKLDIDELHQAALDNLMQRSQSMSAHAAQDENGAVNLILFQTLDGYDASRILLPNLHERLREYLGSPFGAGIPNRDILICFRNDAATLSKIRRQITEDFRAMPHQVTERPLLVTADGIAPMEESGPAD